MSARTGSRFSFDLLGRNCRGGSRAAPTAVIPELQDFFNSPLKGGVVPLSSPGEPSFINRARPRISPQLPYSPQSRNPLSCARRGGANLPHGPEREGAEVFMGRGDGARMGAANPPEEFSIAPSSVVFDTRSPGLLKKPVSGSAAWRFTRRGRDGFVGTGLRACPALRGCPSPGQARRPVPTMNNSMIGIPSLLGGLFPAGECAHGIEDNGGNKNNDIFDKIG